MGMWRRAGSDAAVFAGAALLMAALQAAYRFVALRALPVSDSGRIALVLSVFNTLLLVGHFGVPVALARLVAREDRRILDASLTLAALRAVAVPCAVATLAVGAGAELVTRSSGDGVIVAAGMAPMVASFVASGLLRGRGSVWRAAAIQPTNAALQLVALGGFALAGSVTVRAVLLSFVLGNVAALSGACALLRTSGSTLTLRPIPAEASARAMAGFGAWLTVSSFAIYALTILPRLALAGRSYQEVAFFDLAILIYTIPQRLTAALVTALIPLVARAQRAAQKVAVPARSDAVALLIGVGIIDAILWRTHGIEGVLSMLGLARYREAAPILLLLATAAPAELLFSVDAALLQAFGQSRRLAAVTVLVLGAMAGPFFAGLSPTYLALVVAVAYWLLYVAVRRTVSPEAVFEVSLLRYARERLRRHGGRILARES